MAEKIEIEIVAKDSTAKGLSSVSDKLKTLGSDLSKTGRGMSNMFTRPLMDLERFLMKNEEVKTALAPATEAWSKLGDQLATSLVPAITAITPALVSLAASLSQIIAGFSALPVGTQEAVIGFLAVLAAAGPVLIVVGQIVTAVGALTTAWGAFTAFIGPVVAPAITAIGALLAGITLPVWGLIAAIGLLIAAIVIFGKQAWENLQRIYTEWFKLLGAIKDYFVNAWTEIWQGLVKRIVDIKNAFLNANWNEIGAQMMAGIKNGIVAGVSSIVNAARNAATSAYNAARNALGIRSPSVMFEGIGTQMMRGMALGISGASSMPVMATQSVVGAVSSPAVAASSRSGGSQVNINLVYSPLVSLADRAEAEQKLVPFIESALRKARK